MTNPSTQQQYLTEMLFLQKFKNSPLNCNVYVYQSHNSKRKWPDSF